MAAHQKNLRVIRSTKVEHNERRETGTGARASASASNEEERHRGSPLDRDHRVDRQREEQHREGVLTPQEPSVHESHTVIPQQWASQTVRGGPRVTGRTCTHLAP